MRKSLAIGGALLALAVFASTADARMMGGGGGMSMSASMSHGAPMSSSMGSPRGFSPDGFQTRVRGSNWKKPIDSDGGGPADPQPKPPKTQTGDSGGSHDPYGGYHGGWGPGHHPHYGPYGGPYGGNGNSGDGNVPQRDCRGCRAVND